MVVIEAIDRFGVGVKYEFLNLIYAIKFWSHSGLIKCIIASKGLLMR